MKHLGDITKINGAEIEPVDCITGGSPCQDLSIAGNRAGLAGERSGLFMEQVRIVKEMRDATRVTGAVKPRWMVWENVPGAFSSNKGRDFQAVLTEIVKIIEPDSPDVPMPDKGKWAKAGCLYDEMGRWSVAWRVHDAQFWGVPQRRKRIALVADFGGMCAPEVLFERKGLSRDLEPCGEARQEAAGTTGDGFTSASGALNPQDPQSKRVFDPQGVGPTLNSGTTEGMNIVPSVMCANPWYSQSARVYSSYGVWHSLNANENGGQSRDSVFCLQGNASGRNSPLVYENHSQDSRYKPLGEISETVNAKYCTGGNNQPLVVSDVLPFDTTQVTSDKNWSNPHYGDPCHPLTAGMHPPAVAIGNGQMCNISMKPLANTLGTMHDQQAVMVAAVDCRHGTENPNINGTLQAKSTGGTGTNFNNVLRTNAIVRRLTPLECERLQGYPDGWTDIGEWVDSKGKRHKPADSPRYKALGNSIALPFWFYLLRRISAQYERQATLGSLFDGIGGFPLCWERCNGKGTARWESEIEEFPIAVTKKRFGDECC